MKAKWILLAVPVALVFALSAPVEAGGYKDGYYGGTYYGHGKYRHGDYRYGGRHKAYRYGYRSGYRHAGRGYHGAYSKPYRAFRHGYRKGYRHGYLHSPKRSYYPDAYRYDPLLGHVRGIYFPSGRISLYFGF